MEETAQRGAGQDQRGIVALLPRVSHGLNGVLTPLIISLGPKLEYDRVLDVILLSKPMT